MFKSLCIGFLRLRYCTFILFFRYGDMFIHIYPSMLFLEINWTNFEHIIAFTNLELSITRSYTY